MPPRHAYATVNSVTSATASQYPALPSAPKYSDMTLVFDHTSLSSRNSTSSRNSRAAPAPYFTASRCDSERYRPPRRIR